MNPKAINALIIGFLVFLSFVIFVTTILVSVKHSDDLGVMVSAIKGEKITPRRNTAALEEKCLETAGMTSLDVSTDETNGLILIGLDNYDPLKDIRDISMVIAACPSRQLDSFCAGADCPGQQIKARLSRN